MNDTTKSLIQAALKIGGALGVAHGYGDSSQWQELAGALAAAAGIVWDIIHKKNIKQSAQPNVTK